MTRSNDSSEQSMVPERTPLEDSVRRLIRYSIVLYVVVGLLCIGMVAVIVKTVGDAHQTRDALCTLRSDLEVRVASSRKFLDDHPNGIPGVPVETIREGIRNQDRTIHALDSINC